MFNDLEALREIFKDVRLHVGIGVLTKLGLATDGSMFRVQVNLLPENREVVAEMNFPDVYDVTLPEINDLVVVAFVDGHPDEAHVIAIKNSSEEPIPQYARTGDSVKYARTGKKLYLGSDTLVGIGRPNTATTEPLVLGLQLWNYLSAVMDDILQATAIGQCAIGSVFLDPQLRLNLMLHRQIYLDTQATNILSQIAFTERGA